MLVAMLSLVSSGFFPSVLPQTPKCFMYRMLMDTCLLILMMPSNLLLWSERIFFPVPKYLHFYIICLNVDEFKVFTITL